MIEQGQFRKAFGLALELHGNQTRKGSEIPYMGHLLGVTSIVIDDGGSDSEVLAALLHDGPEDSGGEETLALIRNEFGDEVAQIVDHLSDTFEDPKPPWRERKEKYLAELEELPVDDFGRKVFESVPGGQAPQRAIYSAQQVRGWRRDLVPVSGRQGRKPLVLPDPRRHLQAQARRDSAGRGVPRRSGTRCLIRQRSDALGRGRKVDAGLEAEFLEVLDRRALECGHQIFLSRLAEDGPVEDQGLQ